MCPDFTDFFGDSLDFLEGLALDFLEGLALDDVDSVVVLLTKDVLFRPWCSRNDVTPYDALTTTLLPATPGDRGGPPAPCVWGLAEHRY